MAATRRLFRDRTVEVYEDRIVLHPTTLAITDRQLHFNDVTAIAERPLAANEWPGGTKVLALRHQDRWHEVPPIPRALALELLANAPRFAILIEHWPPELGKIDSASERPPLLVREYKTHELFESEAGELVKLGYQVASTTQQEQKIGCLNILTFGLYALLLKPKAHLIVTYRFEAPPERI